MMVTTCLLISDDPDDHIELSEALYEVCPDSILMAVTGVNKAIDLVTMKRCIPEYIFLNTNISDFAPDRFFVALESDTVLMGVKVVVFGESLHFDSPRIASRLPGDLSYSQLKDALREIISSKRDSG